MIEKQFQYHSKETLLKYVGMEVEWLTLTGKIRKATLEGNGKRTWLPESGSVYADTVKVKLP